MKHTDAVNDNDEKLIFTILVALVGDKCHVNVTLCSNRLTKQDVAVTTFNSQRNIL